jgi:hypothetical protein
LQALPGQRKHKKPRADRDKLWTILLPRESHCLSFTEFTNFAPSASLSGMITVELAFNHAVQSKSARSTLCMFSGFLFCRLVSGNVGFVPRVAPRSSRHTSRLQMGWLCRALGLSCTLLGCPAGTGYADHLVDTPRWRSYRRIARSYTPHAHMQRSLSEGKSCRHPSCLRYRLPLLAAPRCSFSPRSVLVLRAASTAFNYKLLPILLQFTASTSRYASSPPPPPHR